MIGWQVELINEKGGRETYAVCDEWDEVIIACEMFSMEQGVHDAILITVIDAEKTKWGLP